MTDDERLLLLARRTLHTAFAWNDHNFEPAHKMAKQEAKDCGIDSTEEAEEFLQRIVARGERIL